MKFVLSPEREAELAKLSTELEAWVLELEAIDLAGYDPVLVPLGTGAEPDVPADD